MNLANIKSIIRRITPLEAERLMGFPDHYTDIGDGKGGKTPDAPRYKACGNSWAVNCAAWVTRRIDMVDKMLGNRGIANYATVCSGVEAQSLALKACRIDARPVFFSEIEPFPCRLLATRYPSVHNLGDMTKIKVTEKEITNGTTSIVRPGELDLFSGGTPCQDFSVAGTRRGGERGSNTRSSLCWTWLDLIADLRPRWVLWENVYGCFSTGTPRGADFAKLADALAKCGYDIAWRTLDAQYVRVDGVPPEYGWCGGRGFERAIPQRRRRVWLVGMRVDGRIGEDGDGGRLSPAQEVLFEREGLPGDTQPRRETREGTSSAPCECAQSSAEDVE